MSALASDIEDERRPLPSQTSLSHRPVSNPYGFSSSQYTSTTTNPSWMMQQQQQQQPQYHHYHEQSTTPQKQQQPRYPLPFSKYFISFQLN
jgi:hypothetical protein